jgi:hypothetical protein
MRASTAEGNPPAMEMIDVAVGSLQDPAATMVART